MRTGEYGGMKINREKISLKKGVALKQNEGSEREREEMAEREKERERAKCVEKDGEERPVEWRTMIQQSGNLRKEN